MTPAEAGSAVPRAMGARVLRREDARLVTGGGRYVSDVAVPGLLEAAFVRSPRAHAVIEAVDVEAARAAPGVVAVLLSEDLDGVALPLRAKSATPGYTECDTPVLARGKARMSGEAVALVIADSRYRAEDAAGLVSIAYRDLPPVLTIDDALADGAPAVHDEVPDNRFNHFATATDGLDAAFENADEEVELEIRQQRYCAVAMEARVAIARYDQATQSLTAWLSTQVPHIARTGLAKHLGMPENKVRVIAPDMGGGFGAKCVLYQEDVAVAAAAKLLRRPVRWLSDRSEDFHATMHGREQRHHIRVAADAEGRVHGVRSEIAAANGAYAPWPYTASLDSGQASENVTGPYDIPEYGRQVAAVVTNKAPMGPYRGVGRVIACLGMERAMDELAWRLDLDPLEIRRRNVVRAFPHTTAVGLRFESGNYVGMLDLLEDAMDWKRLRAENAELRGQGIHRGLGLALAVEQSAYGPHSLASRMMEMTFGYDTASVRVEPDGHVRVAVGLHNHGQGHETTIAQIAASELGIDADLIEVIWGDTETVPYGLGTWASRSTVCCGAATILASRDIKAKALRLAADMLEADPADLELEDGRAYVRGTPSRGVPFRDVARRAAHEPNLLPGGEEPGLETTRRFVPPDPGTFASSAHAAHVELDPETGAVRILRYVVAEDCGTIVNPLIVEGQIHGGVAQGVGGALYEDLVYDEAGTLVSGSFMDYLVPTAAEIPDVDVCHLESPTPLVPGGFKGMGEG
ncbi:MAG TPA: xanthine dehydrogenase family protein molybdopterin-binding subunit, partial [Solirubrobacteraceae bacterium]